MNISFNDTKNGGIPKYKMLWGWNPNYHDCIFKFYFDGKTYFDGDYIPLETPLKMAAYLAAYLKDNKKSLENSLAVIDVADIPLFWCKPKKQ